MLKHERDALAAGHRRVAGVDEAGRGPLAGPVVAAAVCIQEERLRDGLPEEFVGLTDSKQLTERQRDDFFDQLRDVDWLDIGVGQASVAEIDKHNILQATYLAMQRAVAQLEPVPDFVLVDGNRLPNWPYAATAIVKGDSKSFSIAAASVLAKVTRDRYMVRLHEKFPHYGFACHKGYGTKQHLAALREHGPCEHHRRSFQPVAQMELFR